jgi:TfoX/Sxy family transcriptional regulator of competence genes
MGMKWKKAPDELVALLAYRMKNIDCEYKKMFGYPVYFKNGNMFTGLQGDNVFLRLSDFEIKRFIEEWPEAKLLEPVPGRIMRSYVVVPKSLYSKEDSFKLWLDKSINYVSSLPKKQKK